ncbi:hypothetical protein FBQ97_09890 [Acidobacteria bacterium ACD]|nr:hypothetical protein [Acidobacteria bacterium ACD]
MNQVLDPVASADGTAVVPARDPVVELLGLSKAFTEGDRRRVVLDRDSMNNSRFLPAHDGPSAAAKVRTYGVHLVQILLSTLWTLV